jgi:CHAT domain-containing protein
VGAPCLRVNPPELRVSPAARKGKNRGADLPEDRQAAAVASREGAVGDLLVGQVDDAIAKLSRAAALAPTNAAILWSDLAAAHLQRYAAASDPYELVLALSAANRAVKNDSKLVAARFNRALALMRLTLRDRAAEEWRLVQSLEQDRNWADEDRRHIAELARPVSAPDWNRALTTVKALVEEGKTDQVRGVVAGSEQGFREYLEDDLLASWVTEENAGHKPEAHSRWTKVRSIANALAATGGDRMAADLVAQIERLQNDDPAKLQRLLQGLGAYFAGRVLFQKGSYTLAVSRLQTAQDILTREGNPFALWAAYWIARCRYAVADYGPARVQLESLAKVRENGPYQALRGKVFNLKGLIDAIEGRQTASMTSYKLAISAFKTVKETPSAAKASGNLAADLGVVGQLDAAWRQLVPGLTEPATYGTPEIRAILYSVGSQLAQQQGEMEIALWFQSEMVSNLQRAKEQQGIISALCKRASILASLGEPKAAADDLAQAHKFLAQIQEPGLRRSLEGDVLLAEAQLAAGTPRLAIQKLNDTIPILRQTSYHYRLGQALILRAGAKQALGENDGAEGDLKDAIAEIEAQRETISEPNERISYLDRQRDIFNTMIGFQLERRQRPEAALSFSEQAKARMLWDWIVTGENSEAAPAMAERSVSPALDLRSLQASLPPNTSLIEYAVLPEKTVLWIVRDNGEAPQAVPAGIGEKALGDLVRRLRRALEGGASAEVAALSQQLYDRLIRPAGGFIAPGERLVLIPDGALHVLPFALLRDSETGHYLVQDHALTMAPSARVYAESRRRDREMALRPKPGALVIAAPDFDQSVDPSLSALKAGDTDAAIAQVIPGSRVIREKAATRRAFLRSAGDYGIVHFGGHSVVNTETPLRSQMLFATSPEDASRGVLHSGEILNQRFPGTRLVVLASCATAAGRVSRTEGVESLAQPFLAAGVPAVVASLWSVGDQGTAEFFQRFYHHLAKSSDAAGALQAAQIEFLTQPKGGAVNAKIWGAFEVIGGGMSEGITP